MRLIECRTPNGRIRRVEPKRYCVSGTTLDKKWYLVSHITRKRAVLLEGYVEAFEWDRTPNTINIYREV